MRRIRRIALLLAATLSVGVCGCHSSAAPVVDLEADLQPCTLRVSWWGGDDRHAAMQKAIALWDERYPDISIQPEYGGWEGWTEKVNLQFTGDTAPDMLQINYDWLLHLSPDGEGFLDLSRLDDVVDFTQFSDSLLSYGTVEGHVNAIPVSITGRTLFFQQNVFAQKGLQYPNTWEELLALGERFGEGSPLDLDIDTGFTAWYLCVVYMQQKLGKEFLLADGTLGFTEEEIAEGLRFYQSLEQAGVIRSMQERADEIGTAALYQSPAFLSGDIGGVLEWGSSVSKYESVLENDSLALGALLTSADAVCSGWMVKPSLLYAVNARSAHPKEAATFLNFLLSDPDCALLLGTTRGIPCSQSAFNALQDHGMLGDLAYRSTQQILNADPYIISPYLENEALKVHYNRAIEQVSYGVATPEEAAKEMMQGIQTAVQRIRG